MWIRPLKKFWNYTPIGYVLAVVWNCCELLGVSMPCAPLAFSLI